MTFYVLEPEVSGDFGESSVLDHSTRPFTVVTLDYEFSVWLGDDLLETHPCFVVTERLRDALNGFGGTGYSFHNMTTSKSDDFDEVCPGVQLPHCYWMKVHGVPGVDDVGLRAKDQSLVVSERLLALLRTFTITHCLVRRKPYRVGD